MVRGALEVHAQGDAERHREAVPRSLQKGRQGRGSKDKVKASQGRSELMTSGVTAVERNLPSNGPLHGGSSRSITVHVVLRRDPSRTTSLRNSFARDAAKRFRELRGVIRRAVVEEDVFGLREPEPGEVTITLLQRMRTPGRRAFAFGRSGDKVDSFMGWLREQEDAGMLEITQRAQLGVGIEGAWTDKYIQSSYQRGILRARQELKGQGFDVPSIAESGGINAVFNQPFHLDRVGLMYTRTFNDLKGITTAMDAQIGRVLAQGMAEGRGPVEIARLLTRTISGPVGDLGLTDTLGRFIPAERRAKVLARTEVIRAHHMATVQEYKNWAVEGVVVKAEWATSGFKVCPDCQALEGQIFTLDEIEGMIPLHAQCRCITIPVKAVEAERERPAEEGVLGPEVIPPLPRMRGLRPAFNKAKPYLQPGDVAAVHVLDDTTFRALPGIVQGDVGFFNTATREMFFNELAMGLESSPQARILHEIGHAVGNRIALTSEVELIEFWQPFAQFLSGPQRTSVSEGIAELFSIRLDEPRRFARMVGRKNVSIFDKLMRKGVRLGDEAIAGIRGAVDDALRDVHSFGAQRGVEKLTLIDGEGNTIVAIGAEPDVLEGARVGLTRAQQTTADRMRNVRVIHNHPLEQTFSAGDIVQFGDLPGFEQGLITLPSGEVHVITKPPGVTFGRREASKIIGRQREILVDKYLDDIVEGVMKKADGEGKALIQAIKEHDLKFSTRRPRFLR